VDGLVGQAQIVHGGIAGRVLVQSRLPPLPSLGPLAGLGELVARQDRSGAGAERGGRQFHLDRHLVRRDLGHDLGGAVRGQIELDLPFRLGTRRVLIQLAPIGSFRLPLGQNLSRAGVKQLEFGDDGQLRIADLQRGPAPQVINAGAAV